MNQGSYQLLDKHPTKILAKIVKQLNLLKDNKGIGSELYHSLKLTKSHAPRFYYQPKLCNSGATVRLVVSCTGSPLCNLNTLQLAYKFLL